MRRGKGHYLFLTPLEHKPSVVRTVHHRAKTVITMEDDKKREQEHINKASKRVALTKAMP